MQEFLKAREDREPKRGTRRAS